MPHSVLDAAMPALPYIILYHVICLFIAAFLTTISDKLDSVIKDIASYSTAQRITIFLALPYALPIIFWYLLLTAPRHVKGDKPKV